MYTLERIVAEDWARTRTLMASINEVSQFPLLYLQYCFAGRGSCMGKLADLACLTQHPGSTGAAVHDRSGPAQQHNRPSLRLQWQL